MAIRRLEIETDGQKNPAELFESFKQNAEAIGANVCKVKGQAGVKGKVGEIIKDLAAEKILVAPATLIEKFSLKETLQKCELVLDKLLQNGLDAEVGITEADFAVAETGSLGLDCSDVNVRLASAVAPVHIAVILQETIIDKFTDSFKLVVKNYQGATSYFNYISGPSRTADIERVLTIGVHGPEKLFIIVVE